MLLAALGACAGSTRPPGFSEGTHWAIPILGALGDGTPIAPVTIDGKGPYLFAVDASAASALDPRLARELGLHAREAEAPEAGPAAVPVPRITLGNLTVTAARFQVRDVRATHHGRPVQGSIGREVLHPSLLWTLDRDRQTIHLAVPGHRAAPADAERVAVRTAASHGRGGLVVEARLGEDTAATVRMSFDAPSAIRPALAEQAGLRPIGERSWMAGEVRVGASRAREVLLSALVPGATPGRPAPAADIDGVLGARFWARFTISVLLRDQALWLQPRAGEVSALTAERLARWGALFDGCDTPACVIPSVTAPVPAGDAGAPDRPGAAGDATEMPVEPGTGRLVLTRDPRKQDMAYDVLLQAFDEVDVPLPAPYLLVALPEGAAEVTRDLTSIATAYERATSFRVVDATPFPPPCRSEQGCVWLER